MNKHYRDFILVIFISIVAAIISFPQQLDFNIPIINRSVSLHGPVFRLPFLNSGQPFFFELKQGLDIQGGMQVVLLADMSDIPEDERDLAIESAKEVILRRVDLFGINEPKVQTSKHQGDYRLVVELAGVSDSTQALALIGQTAQLDFRLLDSTTEATTSAAIDFEQFKSVGLTGSQLKRSTVQFDPNTGEPIVSLEFDGEGQKIFADITTENTGGVLGIFLDEVPLMLPRIQSPITNGSAVITGSFTLDEAKNLSIQLTAGAVPVPISVLEQRQIGASLGQDSVQKSVFAGLIGISLVMIFMILYYGLNGLLASIALIIYSLITVAVYKFMGVVLTLPGIAGMLLTIGMAVDSNILIFERMKEELRSGRSKAVAIELGFGRAWDSIKDANLATIATALVLINPFDLWFLNTSGLVRGFGITLLIGVIASLFTGIVVTRTLMRVFIKTESGSDA